VRPDHRRVEAAAGGYRPPLSTTTQRLDRERTPNGLPGGANADRDGIPPPPNSWRCPRSPCAVDQTRNRLIDDQETKKPGHSCSRGASMTDGPWVPSAAGGVSDTAPTPAQSLGSVLTAFSLASRVSPLAAP
jgi:hypothetical protein